MLARTTIALIAALAPHVALADDCTLPDAHQIFVPTAYNEQAGEAVAIDGGIAIVGKSLGGLPLDDAGAAYVVDASTGTVMHTLASPEPSQNDGFGYATAIDGTSVVVSAIRGDLGDFDAGSAFVFDATTGALQQVLTAPVPVLDARFGRSVDIHDGRVVVGAVWDPIVAPEAGAAYVFDATTGALVHALTANDGQFGDSFGTSVAIHGNRIAVGANGEDEGGNLAGAIYLFDATTGAQLEKVLAPNAGEFDFIGHSVQLTDDHLVYGDFRDATNGINAGLIHVHDAHDGAFLRTIEPLDPSSGADFGFAISARDDKLLIGARRDPEAGYAAGALYLAHLDTGAILDKIVPANVTPEDQLGFAIGLGETVAIAGAPQDDVLVGQGGSQYIVEVECATPGDLSGDGSVDVTDVLQLLSSWGVCGDCPADFDGDGVVDTADLLFLLGLFG